MLISVGSVGRDGQRQCRSPRTLDHQWTSALLGPDRGLGRNGTVQHPAGAFNPFKTSTLESSTSTSFSDLQKGPIVLISGFDNQWTMRVTDPLRFHFVRTSTDDYTIQDRTDQEQSPLEHQYSSPRSPR